MTKLLIVLMAFGAISAQAACSIESSQKGLRINWVTVQPIYQEMDMRINDLDECIRKAEDVHNMLLSERTYKKTVMKFWNVDEETQRQLVNARNAGFIIAPSGGKDVEKKVFRNE